MVRDGAYAPPHHQGLRALPHLTTSSGGAAQAAPRSMGHGRTETYIRTLATESARAWHRLTLSNYRGRREGRVAAAPGALAQRKFARARKPQVQADTLRPSLRSGLRLIRTLLGEPSRLPPSPRAHLAQSLAPDLWGARTTRLRRPHQRRSSVSASRVHRIPASRLVTIAIRPSASEAG
jgi:hypothetical protein